MRRLAVVFTVGVLAGSAVALGPAAPPASASVPGAICGIAGKFSGILGTACSAVTSPGSLLSKGKQLLQGLLGAGGSTAAKVAGFAALALWVAGGAKFAIESVMKVLGDTTNPDLGSSWFSGTYWRVVAIAALLTLPFLFAAAIQSLLRSDLALLLRAAFGYLPLAMLAVGIAGPLTTLLLSASDEMSSIVTAAAGRGSPSAFAGMVLAGIGIGHSPFFGFLVAALGAIAALVLWLELVVREAAVYVIVLMLPLAFAAMVWPARRVWALRAVELLIALILAKFAIVAVVVLGGTALAHVGVNSVGGAIAGIAMLLMATFAPWAMLRLLPFSEVAAAAAGSFGAQARSGFRDVMSQRGTIFETAAATHDLADSVAAAMRNDAEQVRDASPDPRPSLPLAATGTADGSESAPTPPDVAPTPEPEAAGGPVFASTTAASNGGAPDPPESDERLPGFDPIWQQPNMTWRPTLDADDRPQTPEEPPPDPPEEPPALPPPSPTDPK
jgi:hypothetical protein